MKYNTTLGVNTKIQIEYSEEEYDRLSKMRERCIMPRAIAKREIESGRVFCINNEEKNENKRIYVFQEPEGFCPAVCASFYSRKGAFLFTYPWNGMEGIYSRKTGKYVLTIPRTFKGMEDVTINKINIGTTKGFLRPNINIVVEGTNKEGNFCKEEAFDWHGAIPSYSKEQDF